MSGLYAYCVLPEGRRPPADLAGLHDRPVRGYDLEGLSVWASELGEPPALDLDTVRRHHAVVSAALGEAVVPLRFGAWQPDLDGLVARIHASSSDLAASLRRVHGRVELGMRIVGHPSDSRAPEEMLEPPRQPVSGREYLRALSRRNGARGERRREQEALAERLRAHMGAMAAEQRVHYLSPPDFISVAHLVARGDEPRYRDRAATFAASTPGEVVVHVTGPWPPYSFAQS